MNYIEKAKYELILGIKNKEDEQVLEVLKSYYSDIVDIIKNNKNTELEDKKEIKFILNVYKDEKHSSCERFFFTDKNKVIHFYNNSLPYEDFHIITINIVENIDSELYHKSSKEIPYENWKQLI